MRLLVALDGTHPCWQSPKSVDRNRASDLPSDRTQRPPAAMLRATVLFALLAAPAFADTARIIDADSLQIGDEVFRINGIDAPKLLMVQNS